MMPAVLLIKKDHLKKGLPAGFGWNQQTQRITVDHQLFNVVCDDFESQQSSRSFEINTVTDIETLKDQFLNKPLVGVVKCHKQYKEYRGRGDAEGNRQVEYFTMSDEFVVFVDTTNGDVVQRLQELFEKAKQLMNNNAKFVLTFDLDETVKLWYAQVAHANSEGRTAQAVGASFHLVHNAQPRSNCATCCFGCEHPVQKAMWCLCLPCCLLTGLPYFICRKCVRNINDVKISTRFYTQEHNAVSQPGFNLHNLLNPAPASVTAQPVAYGAQPVAYGAQPVAYGAQPVAYGAQPVAYGAQPVAYQYPQQPTMPPQYNPQSVSYQQWPVQ